MAAGKLAATLSPLVVALSAMVAVGVAGWRRTRPLRLGTVPRGRPPSPPVVRSTSRLTLVPAVAGVWLAVVGVGLALTGSVSGIRNPAAPMVAMAVMGSLVAWTGWSARVIRLWIDHDGLSVEYRHRPPFRVVWGELTRVAVPRWPLGGWSLTAGSGGRKLRRTLMPSDVLGNEWVLGAAVALARLSYEGRAWSRPPVEP